MKEMINEKDKNQAAEDLRRISTGHPEVKAICFDFKFPGRGQRDTPVTDAKGIVKIQKFAPTLLLKTAFPRTLHARIQGEGQESSS